jgi:hypothetical protein
MLNVIILKFAAPKVHTDDFLFQDFLQTIRQYRLTTEQASTLKSIGRAFAYAEEFTCYPPTVFMIFVTFVETAFFIYHVIHLPGAKIVFLRP